MTKKEEMKKYCPQPRPPQRKKRSGYEMTVEIGRANGRWVSGPVLTAALWDRYKTPAGVWRFCRGCFLGEKRGEEKTKDEMRPTNFYTGESYATRK